MKPRVVDIPGPDLAVANKHENSNEDVQSPRDHGIGVAVNSCAAS